MRLINASKFFDRDSVYDGYTGEYLFKGQFASFDSSAPDGSFQRRRTVSTAPGISFPSRRVVTVHNEKWLLGLPTTDGFFNKPIRQTASAKQVTELYSVLSPGEAADNVTQAVQQIYIFADYHKDTVDANSSSLYDPQYICSAAPSERLYSGQFLRTSQMMLHLRSVQDSTLGFTDMLADEVAYNTRQSTQWPEVWGRTALVELRLAGPIDPITEESSTETTGTGLIMDRTKLYGFGHESAPENLSGDMSLLLSKVSFPTVKVGSKVKVQNVDWLILSSVPYFDATLNHVRRS